MSISTLKLELFIGGYFFIIFVSYPFISKYYTLNELTLLISSIKEYAFFIIPNIIIFSYTIGTLSNSMGFFITDHLFARRYKQKYFGEAYKNENSKYNYKKIKSAVFENSIGYATTRLDFHHNNIRLIRSIIFDILVSLIIILFMWHMDHKIYVSTYYIYFCIIALLALPMQLNNSSKTYYEDMKKAYDMLIEEKKKKNIKRNFYWRKHESNF